jgi:hypothetical protein
MARTVSAGDGTTAVSASNPQAGRNLPAASTDRESCEHFPCQPAYQLSSAERWTSLVISFRFFARPKTRGTLGSEAVLSFSFAFLGATVGRGLALLGSGIRVFAC